VSTTNSRSPISNPSASPQQSGKSGKKRWFWLGLGLCGVAALSASAGALLAVAIAGTPLMQTELTPEEAEVFNQGDISTGMNFRLPQLTRPVNILVLGVKVLASDVDNPPPESQGLGYHATINSLKGLTDSMLLLRFNPANRQLVVLSLPRDTRTYVDGAGLTKINEANVLGGPALAARSTSDLLGGVGIDRYIRINVLGVEKLIDALGGITVYVPQDMKYQDDSQHLYINLKQGEQRLNGAQAVQFLRFRYDAYGDIGRVQRQQMFLRAMREQALKPATIARLPQILSVVQSNLDTNLTVEELIALAGFASQIDRSQMQMLMLPGTFSGGEFEASYWLPNQPQIETMVQQYFGLTAPAFASADGSDHITIAIQDSTNQAEAVEKLIHSLGSVGYSDIFIDQPWDEPLAVTRIIAQHGDAEKAKAIQASLGFGEVLVESTGSLDSDITIRLGQDAIAATSSAVGAAAVESIDPPVEPSTSEATEVPSVSPSEVPPEATETPEAPEAHRIEATRLSAPQPAASTDPAVLVSPLPASEQPTPAPAVDQSQIPDLPASPETDPSETDPPGNPEAPVPQ
jgi:LCP family protein required for cell wall assembly